MLKFLVIAAVLAIAVVLTIALSRSDDFRVQRSLVIKAPPEKIAALIENLRGWKSWSPYEQLDPAMQRSYSGPDSGPGAAYAWSGNGKVGQGRMEIIEATPDHITIKLDFIKPMPGHNTAEFDLRPEGDSTEVTWVMSGPRPFIAKLLSVFFNMDKMIGGEFEKGLGSLKTLAEQPA
jgi:hypothetical protein